jgi:hypothetical protein
MGMQTILSDNVRPHKTGGMAASLEYGSALPAGSAHPERTPLNSDEAQPNEAEQSFAQSPR